MEHMKECLKRPRIRPGTRDELPHLHSAKLTELAWLLDRKRAQRSGIMQAPHACDPDSTPNVRNVREVRIGCCTCYFLPTTGTGQPKTNMRKVSVELEKVAQTTDLGFATLLRLATSRSRGDRSQLFHSWALGSSILSPGRFSPEPWQVQSWEAQPFTLSLGKFTSEPWDVQL